MWGREWQIWKLFYGKSTNISHKFPPSCFLWGSVIWFHLNCCINGIIFCSVLQISLKLNPHKRGWRLCLQNYLAKRIRQKFWQFSRSQKHYSGLKDTKLIQQIKSTHSQLLQIIISNQLKCNSYKVIAWWELTPKDERMYPSRCCCEFIQRVTLWQNIYWIISPLAAFRWKKGSRDVDSVF